MDKHLTFRVSRRGIRMAFILAVVVTVLAPVAVIAAGGTFTDDDTSIFEGNIEWMAANNITAGCNPPANDHYCPNDAVTRGQMAAFMQRLATNKVVDAATAVSADDAGLLDGSDSTAYRTVITGISCNIANCVDPGNLTNSEMLELSITAPVAGYLQLNGVLNASVSSATNDYVASWMTLNGDTSLFEGCEGSFLGIPLGDNVIVGTQRFDWLDGNVFYANTAAAPVIAVPAGTHTLRLCGFSNTAADTYAASLSATWTAEGTATTASATTRTIDDHSPEFIALLETATAG